MIVVLYLFGLLALLAGMVVVVISSTALHEIEYLILFLIAAVLIGSASVVGAIGSLEKTIFFSHANRTNEKQEVSPSESEVSIEPRAGFMKGDVLFAIIVCFLAAIAMFFYHLFR